MTGARTVAVAKTSIIEARRHVGYEVPVPEREVGERIDPARAQSRGLDPAALALRQRRSHIVAFGRDARCRFRLRAVIGSSAPDGARTRTYGF
jgi:hypothetical protein